MATVFRPPFFVPKPVEEPPWLGVPKAVPVIIGLLAVLLPPFLLNQHETRQFNIVEETYWQWRPENRLPLLPTTTTLPFSNQRQFNLAEDIPAQKSIPYVITFTPHNPFSTPQWNDFVEDPPWLGKSRSVPLTITSPAAAAPFANQRQFNISEETYQRWAPQNRLPLLPETFQIHNSFPMVFDDSVGWVGKSTPTNFALFLPPPPETVVGTRQSNFVEEPPWLGAPKSSPLTITFQATAVLPFSNPRSFNLAEDIPWLAEPRPVPFIITTPPVANPFFNFHWNNIPDEAYWQYRSPSQAALPLPPYRIRNVFPTGFEEQPPWVGKPRPAAFPPTVVQSTLPFSNIRRYDVGEDPPAFKRIPYVVTLPKVPNPFVNRWQLNPGDEAYWLWPVSSSQISPPPITIQIHNVFPAGYDDSIGWVGKSQASNPNLFPVPAPPHIISTTHQFNFVEDPVWVGAPTPIPLVVFAIPPPTLPFSNPRHFETQPEPVWAQGSVPVPQALLPIPVTPTIAASTRQFNFVEDPPTPVIVRYAVRLPAPVGLPFFNSRQYYIAEETYWTGHAETIFPQFAPPAQAPPLNVTRWNFNTVPDPDWVKYASPSTIPLLRPPVPATIQGTRQFNFVDEPWWLGAPKSIPVLYVPITAPFTPPRWNNVTPEEPPWTFRPPVITKAFPFIAPRWNFNVGEDPIPRSVQLLTYPYLPQAGTPLLPARWNFYIPDEPVWKMTGRASATLYLPTPTGVTLIQRTITGTGI